MKKPNQFPSLALWLLLALAFIAVICKGQDISPGQTFVDGQRLTAAELSQLVSQATLQPQAITGKPNQTSVAAGDYFLVYNAAANALYKVSGQALLTGNTSLITGQAEKVPVTNDFVLGYDSTGLTLVKMQLANLWSNGIANLTVVPTTNLSLGAFFHILNGPTNGQTAISNLFAIFPYTQPFTNLPVRSAPTNWDNLLLAGSQDNTNFTMYRISLAQLFTNLPAVTAVTNGDRVLVWSTGTNSLDANGTNPFVASVPVQALGPRTLVVNNLPCTNQAVLQTNLALLNGAAYAVPPFVRAVLVVTNVAGFNNPQLGWTNGDELDASWVYTVAHPTNRIFTFGSTPTNVWLNGNFVYGSGIFIPYKVGSTSAQPFVNEPANAFSLKVYIVAFP